MTELQICLEGTLKPHHAPLLFASEAGLFEGRDLSVDWTSPEQKARSLDSLIDGNADVAVTRPLNLVSEFLQGTEVVGIARFFHTNSGVMYRNDREYEKLTELPDEANILCSDIIPSQARTLLSAMSQNGGGPDDAIGDFVFDEPDGDPIETFYEGNHDAFITAGVNPEGVQMEQANFEVDFWFYDEYDVPANGDLVLATTPEQADEQPNLMKDFVHSLHDAVNVLDNDADRGRSLIEDNYEEILNIPGGQALLFTSFSELTTNFSQDFQNYTAWGDFMTEQGEVGGFVDVDRLLDERFIPLDSMTF